MQMFFSVHINTQWRISIFDDVLASLKIVAAFHLCLSVKLLILGEMLNLYDVFW